MRGCRRLRLTTECEDSSSCRLQLDFDVPTRLAHLIHAAGKNERIILFLQRLMFRLAVAKNATGQFAETFADDGLCSEWLNLVNNPD